MLQNANNVEVKFFTADNKFILCSHCLIQLVVASERAFGWTVKMFLAKRFRLEIHKLQGAPVLVLRSNKVKQLHFCFLVLQS